MLRIDVDRLPDSALDASIAFMADHLQPARRMLNDPASTALVILLPPAPHDHRDWRLALARDLAREATPKRVNVVSGREGDARDTTLRFLADAPGVTGQYLICHE
ncbi:Rossmann fold domain-containing protein [Erythrobacter sp. R86502]|uniref:Rossmann fold domain-containing protein n=1 Tax=Erythrobacter sp. R86502 TaxID=3093846 RepID=UPI0036D2CEC3